MPPEECIEIALWDRFHWSWRDTDGLDQAKMRRIFVVLEQQRATKDAVENLGRPNEDRIRSKILKQRAMDEEAAGHSQEEEEE
jgi:hypothetical protein